MAVHSVDIYLDTYVRDGYETRSHYEKLLGMYSLVQSSTALGAAVLGTLFYYFDDPNSFRVWSLLQKIVQVANFNCFQRFMHKYTTGIVGATNNIWALWSLSEWVILVAMVDYTPWFMSDKN